MKQKPKLQLLDPEFDHAVDEYAESLVEMEKKEFRPGGVEPFQAHAEKIKARVSDAMHAFYNTYANGYSVLLNELGKMFPGDLLDSFKVKVDNIKQLDEFMNFLTSGHSIHEMLGFSEDAIEKFYEAGLQLIQQKRFEEAKDGFYFLVTIAPLVTEAWLGLGYSYAECKEREAAIQALTHAVELAPDRPDVYLTFARVHINMQEFDQAKKVCDMGLAYAAEHSQDGKELITYLEEAKRQIDLLSKGEIL